MEQAEQAQIKRHARIEHEFGATDPVLVEEPCTHEIHRIERLKYQEARGLPGKYQRAFQS